MRSFRISLAPLRNNSLLVAVSAHGFIAFARLSRLVCAWFAHSADRSSFSLVCLLVLAPLDSQFMPLVLFLRTTSARVCALLFRISFSRSFFRFARSFTRHRFSFSHSALHSGSRITSSRTAHTLCLARSRACLPLRASMDHKFAYGSLCVCADLVLRSHTRITRGWIALASLWTSLRTRTVTRLTLRCTRTHLTHTSASHALSFTPHRTPHARTQLAWSSAFILAFSQIFFCSRILLDRFYTHSFSLCTLWITHWISWMVSFRSLVFITLFHLVGLSRSHVTSRPLDLPRTWIVPLLDLRFRSHAHASGSGWFADGSHALRLRILAHLSPRLSPLSFLIVVCTRASHLSWFIVADRIIVLRITLTSRFALVLSSRLRLCGHNHSPHPDGCVTPHSFTRVLPRFLHSFVASDRFFPRLDGSRRITGSHWILTLVCTLSAHAHWITHSGSHRTPHTRPHAHRFAWFTHFPGLHPGSLRDHTFTASRTLDRSGLGPHLCLDRLHTRSHSRSHLSFGRSLILSLVLVLTLPHGSYVCTHARTWILSLSGSGSLSLFRFAGHSDRSFLGSFSFA